jgi:two-component system chemotaxis sensor kinase CheA
MLEKNQLEDIIREFLSESRENIDEVERDLVAWEKQPTGKKAVDRIFRTFHTLKGTCSLLGFERLESIAHQAESVLCGVQDGHLAIDSTTITALLKVSDAIRLLLREIDATGEEGEGDYAVLVAELNLKALQKQVMGNKEVAARQSTEEALAGPTTENTIRVKVALLDLLMNLTGELMAERDEIMRISIAKNDPPLGKTSSRIGHIISELQKCIAKARRQPIGNIWNKFPRLIRDTTLSTGKKIRLDTSGRQMEIDKSILEAIRDPLTHLVRNCIDHGIETPEKRLISGKPEEGCITLRAFEQNGDVVIEVEDDGSGIHVDLIRETAIRRAMITPEQALTMNEHEFHHLIFLAGFTTAPEVTKLSGRGMGMNVVKTNLDCIRGAIDIVSRPGMGTLFRIKIPPVAPAKTRL